MRDKKIWTVPNILSFMRMIIFVPILFFLNRGRLPEALIFMAVGLATDFLDGFIARRFNRKSDLGRVIDPLADKICVLSVVLFLVISPRYAFPLWFFLFILFRELAVLSGGLIVLRKQNIVLESNRAGKNSALATALTVLLFIFHLRPWADIMLMLALLLNLFSTWSYYQNYHTQLKLNTIEKS